MFKILKVAMDIGLVKINQETFGEQKKLRTFAARLRVIGNKEKSLGFGSFKKL